MKIKKSDTRLSTEFLLISWAAMSGKKIRLLSPFIKLLDTLDQKTQRGVINTPLVQF